MTIEIEPISESDYKRKRKKWGEQLDARDRVKMKEAIRRYEQIAKKPEVYYINGKER